jgi:phosphatidylinositol-bisphosphatase
MIWSGKARWEQQARDHLGEDYRLVGSQNMGAIHIMVFVHQYLWRYCWDVKNAQVATGFGNVVGNKGGTQVGFSLGHTSLLFINVHLPAHQGKMKERTQSMARILEDSPIRRQKSSNRLVRTNSHVSGVSAPRESYGVHDDYDRVFFMGDLNTRVNASRSEVDEWLSQRQMGKLLEQDQLLPLLRAGPDAARPDAAEGYWPLFEEADITFRPTYKFDSDSDRYDSSKKQRVPSWTDRILWKRDQNVRSLAYTSVETLTCSDHRPVFGQFEVTVDLHDWQGPNPDSPKHIASSRAGTSDRFSRKDDKSVICSVQ